jgi:hypothetical protein
MNNFRKSIFPFALVACSIASSAYATGTHQTRSYVKKDGTYVKPHKQTNPNKTQRDNWGAKGNMNLSTGKKGTKKAQH